MTPEPFLSPFRFPRYGVDGVGRGAGGVGGRGGGGAGGRGGGSGIVVKEDS